MSKLVIEGGKKLSGKVAVAGNKNSALKLLAAALLSDSPSTLTNVPRIRDVEVMSDIIRDLGATASQNKDGVITIDPSGLSSGTPDPALMERIRASVVLAVPLLLRLGKVRLPQPGGDSIGERIIDTHLSMLEKFGAECKKDTKGCDIYAKNIKPGNIFLEEASVTATEMALMLAARLPGESTIEGAAAEPHVQDLAEMLSRMGAKIEGAGTNIVRVRGSRNLVGVEHRVRPDHIEVGTFAIASAITGGEAEIEDARWEDLRMILAYLSKMGIRYQIDEENSTLRVLASRLVARQKKFQTRPWPGFPTDLMSPFIVLATQAEGVTLCHDWMYEWRIFFVDHLISMGADVLIADPHRVVVTGPRRLHGEVLPSADIRAGGALVLAGLAAEGETVVEHAEVIDRGYEDFDKRLSALGAKIKRIP